MFTRETLELIEALIDGQTITEEERTRLQRVVSSALWSMSRHLRAKDRKAIEDAEAAGKVKRYGLFESGLDENGKAVQVPQKPKGPDRLKPAAMTATNGDELLKGLGLL